MGLKFKKKFAHKSNYGGKRSTASIEYIVITIPEIKEILHSIMQSISRVLAETHPPIIS